MKFTFIYFFPCSKMFLVSSEMIKIVVDVIVGVAATPDVVFTRLNIATLNNIPQC